MRSLLAVWIGLLALVAAEVAVARGLGMARAAPLFGAVMALLVAWRFMRLDRGPAIVRLFCAAGVFWLAVLLGLGLVDPLTRTTVPVASQTTP